MALFFVLSVDESAGNEPITDISFEELKPCAMSAQKIETMKQKVRTHRAALDFDLLFCMISVIAGSEEKEPILMSTINYSTQWR